MASTFYQSAVLRVIPPWLQRRVGGALMVSMAEAVDAQVDRMAAAVSVRFPLSSQPNALGYIGRERRILRGPVEDDTTFAARLRTWWDAHRIRGGPYALLTQMQAYLAGFLDIRIDCIANSGTHHWIGTDGVITRGSIAGWMGDGEYPAKWARFFLILHAESSVLTFPLVAASGEPILSDAGEPILVNVSIYLLSADDRRIFCTIAREWSAAHIDRIYIALLPSNGILWGYPPTLKWGDAGRTWGGDLAVTWTC